MTEKQEKVLDLLRESKQHLSAKQIFMLANQKGIDVSLASIYRILDILLDKGLIKKVLVSNDQELYDGSVSDHAHLVCLKCGSIKDVHINNFKKILSDNLQEDIKGYNLCVDYICLNCRKENL